jgi:hypothetical protein
MADIGRRFSFSNRFASTGTLVRQHLRLGS